jgi:hypothetical protein
MVEILNDSGETPPTKERTAIVIDVDRDAAGGPFFTIVWGTGSSAPDAILVQPGEAAYEQARLSKATYFGPKGKEFCELEDIWPKEHAEKAPHLAQKIRQKLLSNRRR